jgi:repressor LexA
MPERPTKKQKELLEFIEGFIAEHGYGPSYREIMSGCNYSSVATVALHVNNLIKKGRLRKKDHSARSLEVVDLPKPGRPSASTADGDKEKWLEGLIEVKFAEDGRSLDELETLIGALRILGFNAEASSFQARLEEIKQKHQ